MISLKEKRAQFQARGAERYRMVTQLSRPITREDFNGHNGIRSVVLSLLSLKNGEHKWTSPTFTYLVWDEDRKSVCLMKARLNHWDSKNKYYRLKNGAIKVWTFANDTNKDEMLALAIKWQTANEHKMRAK